MKKDLNDADLVITNGKTNKVRIVKDFFTYSLFTQENILSDIILPILSEDSSLYISVGFKNQARS